MTGAGGNGSLETVISIADRDIYDADGVLLVPKGKKITPQIYRRLLERKVVLKRQGGEFTPPPAQNARWGASGCCSS